MLSVSSYAILILDDRVQIAYYEPKTSYKPQARVGILSACTRTLYYKCMFGPGTRVWLTNE